MRYHSAVKSDAESLKDVPKLINILCLIHPIVSVLHGFSSTESTLCLKLDWRRDELGDPCVFESGL